MELNVYICNVLYYASVLDFVLPASSFPYRSSWYFPGLVSSPVRVDLGQPFWDFSTLGDQYLSISWSLSCPMKE